MKKVVLVFIALFVLLIPLFSAPATASLELIWRTDTGVPAEGPVDTVKVEWEFEACKPLYSYRVVEISYRHTSPKHAGEGGFRDIVVWNEYDDATGIWYGYVEFESWITGERGTNHGDIEISFTSGYPSIEWSFNIRHR